MTTWEVASESELNELRVLIGKVERASGKAPVAEAELKGMTKRRAGQLLTALREMVRGEGEKGGNGQIVNEQRTK